MKELRMPGRSVFTRRERSYHGPLGDAEAEYTFLERSACSHSEYAREAIERWFLSFADASDSEQKITALLTSIRDGRNPNKFKESLLELIAHELIADVTDLIAVEPRFHEPRLLTPDYSFQVDDVEYLVECNVRRGARDPNERPAVKQIWDWINLNVKTHGYLLQIWDYQLGAGNPSLRRLKTALEQKTKELDSVDEEAFYGFMYSDERAGFSIELNMRRKSDLRETGENWSRSIGVYPASAFVGNGSQEIEGAISNKASRYRDLYRPLIIILATSGTLSLQQDFESLLQGALGTNVYDERDAKTISLLAADMGKREGSRRAKAAFGYITQPRNQHVAAILYKQDFGLWTLGQDNWTLLHNPFVKEGFELKGGQFQFAREVTFDSKYRAIVSSRSLNATDVLGLPEDWPYSVACSCK